MSVRRTPPPPADFSGNRTASGRRPRRGRVFPAARRSARIYVYLDPAAVHLFRSMLEAADNLGFMTVVDRWRAALLIRFSPHQEQQLFDFMDEIRETVPFAGPFRCVVQPA